MITDSVWAAGRDHGSLSGAPRAFRYDRGVVRREL